MSLSVGGMIGAGAAAAGIQQGMSDLSSGGQGLVSSYFGKMNSKREMKNAYKLYQWKRDLDWDYFLAENEANFNLAHRYAANSAKWQMQGLKRAGLNPIMAVTGNQPQVISPPSASPDGGSMPSSSIQHDTHGHAANLMSSIRDSAATQYAVSSARNQDAMTDVSRATADKILAESEQIRANTARTLAMTQSEVEKLKSEIRKNDRPKNEFLDGIDTVSYKMLNSIDNFTSHVEDEEHNVIRLEDGRSHSAKARALRDDSTSKETVDWIRSHNHIIPLRDHPPKTDRRNSPLIFR